MGAGISFCCCRSHREADFLDLVRTTGGGGGGDGSVGGGEGSRVCRRRTSSFGGVRGRIDGRHLERGSICARW